MKVIELAEKQRNNEILPKHIRYENEDLYFDGVTYYDEEGNNDFFDILAMNNNALTHLYDEVEIIEEDKDIEELKIGQVENNPSNKYIVNEFGTKCFLTKHSKIMADKINELIKIVNEMKKNER